MAALPAEYRAEPELALAGGADGMDFIRALDVRVTVLHEGSVIAEGRLDTVQNNQRVIDVYLGR